MKNNKGISIVEGVVASALMLLALGGILSLFIQNIKTGKLVDYSYISMNLAKNRVERIREIRREQGLAALSSLSEQNVCLDRNGVSDPNGGFRRTTIVDSSYGANLTKITVRIEYKIMGKWSPQPVEVVTVVSPYL